MTIADFLDRRWGDLIGLSFIICGSVLVIVAHGDKEIFSLGSSLLLSGAVLLRPKTNGNGNGIYPVGGKIL